MSNKQRTIQQNKALHKLFSLISEALNEAGHDMRAVIREDVEIPWTPINVKECLWRPLQKALLQKESTTELTTSEIDQVYDVLNKVIGERTGEHVPFPSIENLINYEE